MPKAKKKEIKDNEDGLKEFIESLSLKDALEKMRLPIIRGGKKD